MTNPGRRFAPLPVDRAPAEAEADVAAFWRDAKVFEATLEQTRGGKPFVFYEGPPTANGMPHHGHVLTRVIKDLFPRYKTMCGFHVERKAGWDTHGLPVEIEVEKVLGLEGKQDIETYGVGPFIEKCRQSVWKYQGEWEKLTERIGFWLDMSRPYITYKPEYVESVWWSLKRIHEKGLLYKGHKILPWCPRDMTGLSSHEVGQGYLEVEDPALTVAFKLTSPLPVAGEVHALAWTTTPWTLLSNVALVVGPEIDYVFARKEGNTFLLARARLEAVLGKGAEVVHGPVKGKTLAGATYEPLFRFHEALKTEGPAHRVVADGFVGAGDGTGIVHAAPAFGEDDNRVCRAAGLAFVNLVRPDGKFVDACGPFAGRWVKEADGDIARDLKRRGLLLKQERIKHEYPHCWRCKTPLLYFAREAWFISTTKLKDQLVGLNKTIEWYPEHIRDGRFGDFLENNKDWALSRERYWGTPLPVWECSCGKFTVVESLAELKRLGANVADGMDPHRPGIDEVTLPRCPHCGGGPLRRAKEVIDCWYDSGAMPFAQWGYPHAPGSKELFAKNFPADFICEAIDQTRGWFYTLHAIATLLFEKTPSYRRCLVLGHVLDAQGNKLSKKDKNYKSPDEVIDAHGADAMRWFFYAQMSPGQGVRFTDEAVRDAKRTFLIKVLNVYKFFQEYASADGFDPRVGGTPRPALADREPLDRWAASALHSTIATVRGALDGYEWNKAAVALEAYVDGLSNWYVRRSRERAWRPPTAGDASKWAFWWTLYEVQTTLARVMAPFVPFLAEDLHRVLVREQGLAGARSVHLERFPEADPAAIDAALEQRMALARRAVDLGVQARRAAKVNLRQPLREVVLLAGSPRDEDDLRALSDVIADELNAKQVAVSHEFDRYVTFDVRPNFNRLGKRLGKNMNAAQRAIKALDPAKLAATVRAGRGVDLDLGGATEQLSSEDFDVRLAARAGLVTAEDKGLVAALDPTISPELKREGLVREVQSRIQSLRKELDLAYDAKVEVTITGAEGELAEAIRGGAAQLREQTGATKVELGPQQAAAALVLPLEADALLEVYLRPFVQALGPKLAAAAPPPAPSVAAQERADEKDKEEEAEVKFLFKGLLGPQQSLVRTYRDRLVQASGVRFKAEFEKPSDRFKKGAVDVVCDGAALDREQRAARVALAHETFVAARATQGLSLGGGSVKLVLAGVGAELRAELAEAWPTSGATASTVIRPQDVASGAIVQRVAPLDAWTLVLGLRVVPR